MAATAQDNTAAELLGLCIAEAAVAIYWQHLDLHATLIASTGNNGAIMNGLQTMQSPNLQCITTTKRRWSSNFNSLRGNVAGLELYVSRSLAWLHNWR